MAVSSFSNWQRVTAVGGAITVVALSWAYFANAWRGVVVSGAGDPGANGYYKWDPTIKLYLRSGNVPTSAWRVPNVYELASRAPEFRKDDEKPVYHTLLLADTNGTRTCAWYLIQGFAVQYVVGTPANGGEAPFICDITPPSTGWTSMPGIMSNRTAASIDPPPQVQVCGKVVPPGAGHVDYAETWASLKQPPVGEWSAVLNYPGTVLVLAINLAFACHLWANQVSYDSVAIGYALFWEDREYWRIITASFSHFDKRHLGLTALAICGRRTLEQSLGTFRYLYTSLNLVVTTIMLMMLFKHALVRWGGFENHREGKAVGFSAVLFAYMTYEALQMSVFSTAGKSYPEMFFTVRTLSTYGALPSTAAHFWVLASLVFTQLIDRRASFVGHLAGVCMGYLMAGGLLDGLSTPILAGFSVMLMLQHSKGWASKMPDFSLLLQGWARGEAERVARARRLSLVLCAHVCLTVTFLSIFTWSTVLAEILALVVGYNAVQALKYCCWPDSAQLKQCFCINLLKAYGALSAILLASDLLSLGALLGQASFVEYSGVSETSRMLGLGLLAIAAAVHGAAVAGCVEGLVTFCDGQTFLWRIGLGQNVVTYTVYSDIDAKKSD